MNDHVSAQLGAFFCSSFVSSIIGLLVDFAARTAAAGIEPAAVVFGAILNGGDVDKIFYARGKGRVYKMLTVYSDGQLYRLHYLILDRTNPSKSERAAGEKERRFETLNQELYVKCGDEVDPNQFPIPELTQQFINFLKKATTHED